MLQRVRGCFQTVCLLVPCMEVHDITSSQLLFLVRLEFIISGGFMP